MKEDEISPTPATFRSIVGVVVAEMRSSSTALMAAAALLLLLVSLSAAADMSIISYKERSEEETRRMFVEWMVTHGRTYYSISEMEHRYAVFKANLRFNDQHNAAAAAGIYSYTLGMNKFGDLTTDEVGAICCGLLLEDETQADLNMTLPEDQMRNEAQVEK